jgi:hypothetical protein
MTSSLHRAVPWLRRRPAIAVARFRTQVSSRVICGGKSGTKTRFSPSTSVSPVSIIPPMVHTHSFIYHRRCIRFFSQYSSFPCQYHSTITPYSFIHLPSTLYNVFLQVLQFPLSVSFHQRSILIRPCSTDALCFSPITSVSPVSIIPPMLHTHSSM